MRVLVVISERREEREREREREVRRRRVCMFNVETNMYVIV